MKPSICLGNNLEITIPENCDLAHWLIPVGKFTDIQTPDRNHAYLTADNDVYVLAHNGNELLKISNNQLWEALRQMMETQKQMQRDLADKADKASPSTVKNIAILNSEGNYVDSKVSMEDIATKIDLQHYETLENKVAISAEATFEQYPNAKSVYDYISETFREVETKLKIPIILDKESHLPQTLKIGDYFIVHDMDITSPAHSGKIWISSENDEIFINRFINNISAMDGNTIIRDDTGLWGVNNDWLNAYLLNRIYPVGSIVEFNNHLNPNIEIGGTWEPFGNGRVTIGIDTTQVDFNEVGKIGGSNTHTLTVNEIPPHRHALRRGWGNDMTANNPDVIRIFTDISVHYPTAAGHSMNSNDAGGGEPHSNLQPYVVVPRWVRTA